MPFRPEAIRLRSSFYPEEGGMVAVIQQEARDMIVVMHSHATRAQIDSVVERIFAMGYRPHVSEGEETTIIGIIGHSSAEQLAPLEFLPGVDHMVPVMKPYKLGSRDFRPKNTVVQVGDVRFGGNEVVIIAGPCSVETEEQLWETAQAVKAAGGKVLR